MAAGATKQRTPCHLVALPYPGRGHINPMMNLCKILSSKVEYDSLRLRVTFVVTEEWLGFIGSEPLPANMSFATIPNVLPSELVRGADMRSFLEATQNKMEEPFERILDRIEEEISSTVNVIVADTFLNWAPDFGKRKGIPVASFWPMSGVTFSLFQNFHLLAPNGHTPWTDRPEVLEELVDYIPGVPSIRVADIPSFAQDVLDDLVLPIFPFVQKAQYLLVSSISEFEPDVFQYMEQEFSSRVLSFGPLIPYFHTQHSPAWTNDHDHYNWLDNKPHGSVLYVSTGSFLSVSDTQLHEIVAGLDDSGVSYFWVAREKTSKIKEMSSSRGLIVRWCNQLQVLSHPSIGGFWTHCGWNSTVEAIFAGVPMLTVPMAIDQFPNSKMIVDDWKMGNRVASGLEPKGVLIKKGHITKVVKEFMDSEREERMDLLRNAKEAQKICRRATEENGSSAANINKFLADFGI